MKRNHIIALALLVLLSMATALARDTELGIGLNLIVLPPNRAITAQEVMDKTGSRFVAHTATDPSGRNRWSVALPGLPSSLAALDPAKGYVISSPRSQTVSLGTPTDSTPTYAVVLFDGTNQVQIVSVDGQLETATTITAIRTGYRPGGLPRGNVADSRNIYAIASTSACVSFIDAFSIATSERTTLATGSCTELEAPSMQQDGTILFHYFDDMHSYNPRTNAFTKLAFTVPDHGNNFLRPIQRGSRIFWIQRMGNSTKYQIYRTGTSLPISNEPDDIFWYDVSADGMRVTYAVLTSAGDFASSEIKVMDANGGNVKQLTADHVSDAAPMFLPDGRIIFGSDRGNPRDIHQMDPDGKNIRLFYRPTTSYGFGINVVQR